MNKMWLVGIMGAGLAYSQGNVIAQKKLCLMHTALVCNKPSRLSECRSYMEGLFIKSQELNGTYYKISEMADRNGIWHAYNEEGWIDKNDVTDVEEDNNVTVVPERIKATTLLVKKAGALVCERPKEDTHCEPYKDGTILTSNAKYKNYYKVSGIGTQRGWQPFVKEGWIKEESVEIRR
ncbi:MAG: hypothetical protein WCS55_08790 [Sulfuricurvum sp.]|uniref:hypothetical protein n=1 Tax=Sulfuricurvum sp. TaxID=2025608 RepID=UPI00356A8DE7